MSDDVFGGDDNATPEGTTLSDLVGEGRKFASIDDLAKGKLEADKFIEQLKNELKNTREQMTQLEQEAAKKATVDDLLRAVKQANSKSEEQGASPISEEKLQEMVSSIMDGRHEKQTRLANYQQANQAVLDKFNGDVESAKAYMAEKSKQLGMPIEQLKSLGETSPSAFKQLMGVEPSKPTVPNGVAGIPGAVSNQGPASHRPEVVDGVRTKAYYDRLKRELGPGKYWMDTKIQGQYTKDAMALKERFNV